MDNERPNISGKLLLYLFGCSVGLVGYLTNATIVANKESITDNKRYGEDTRAALYREIGTLRDQITKNLGALEALKTNVDALKERTSRLEGQQDRSKP